jgi:small subunit ribosomal protein S17
MKIFSGKVIGLKQQKTATVSVQRVKIHPIYKKRFTRVTKYQVHDELGVKIGDLVKFADSRPISKSKKWTIVEIVTEKKGSKK